MEEKPCKISRWQILKNELNNLDHITFFEKLKSKSEALLFDVRTAVEYDCGHVEGAKNLDYFGTDFVDIIDGLDKKKSYFIYCRSGRRSSRVCLILKNAGFKNVFNLDGGLKSIGKFEFNAMKLEPHE